MDEHNKILEQLKIYNISVEEKINTEKRNNILEKLKRPWSWNEWRIKYSS